MSFIFVLKHGSEIILTYASRNYSRGKDTCHQGSVPQIAQTAWNHDSEVAAASLKDGTGNSVDIRTSLDLTHKTSQEVLLHLEDTVSATSGS